MFTRHLIVIAGVGLLMLAATPPVIAADSDAGHETVILLHGLTRSARSMRPMAKALKEAGYRVYALDYPSTSKTVEALAAEHLAPMIARCQLEAPVRIHFVAHSLGNIVLREYFVSNALPNAGRLVMLGPPNQGSEVVDKLGSFAAYDWINGPAGQQLGTDTQSKSMTLPPPPLEYGVIAGTRSINLVLSCLIPGPDDGKVAVSRARIKGMRDFIALPVSHPFIMRDPDAIRCTLHFLRHGRFLEKQGKGIRQ